MAQIISGFGKYMAAVLFVSIGALAQTFDDPLAPSSSTVLKQQGMLFTVQIVRGEPIRFFVVGREEAKLDLSQLAVTVRRVAPYPGKVLRLDRRYDYFVATEPGELKDATILEVTAKAKAKTETMQFQIENKKP